MIFRIEPVNEGRFRLVGELTFDTVPEAHEKSLALFDASETSQEGFCIDLQDVSRTDSAGIALLIDWMRYAKKKNKPLQFLNIPVQMLAIIRVSGLDEILPLRQKQELPRETVSEEEKQGCRDTSGETR